MTIYILGDWESTVDPEHDERQLTTVLTVEVVRRNRLMDQELGVRCVLTGNRVQAGQAARGWFEPQPMNASRRRRRWRRTCAP
ncbi:MAG: hypothetical protein V3U93_00090 [Alphaproteobacteria bacterium]